MSTSAIVSSTSVKETDTRMNANITPATVVINRIADSEIRPRLFTIHATTT